MANAVAPARSDPGTGLCGKVINFVPPNMMPLLNTAQAIDMLNLPPTDPSILGTTVNIFSNMNFMNSDPGATGDFTWPNFADALFPYSSGPNAMPPGSNDNFAMRLRGYLNVTNTLNGTPGTFGINCDDGCFLSIGTTSNGQMIPILAAYEVNAGRATQQVLFKDTGLYPVEIVYYQNASQAYLEWSVAGSAQPEGNQSQPLDTATYSLIPPTSLYSAIAGTNPACQECGAASMPSCPTGEFCGDGLCQSCNVAAHCGPTCAACPANMNVCANGQCVECTNDGMCPAGFRCANSTCTATSTSCTSSAMCPSGMVCDVGSGVCSAAMPSGCRMPARAGELPSGNPWLPGSALLLLGLWRSWRRRWRVPALRADQARLARFTSLAKEEPPRSLSTRTASAQIAASDSRTR